MIHLAHKGKLLRPNLARLTSRICLGLAFAMLFPSLALASEKALNWPPDAHNFLTTIVLAFLVPVGLTLMAIGGSREERAADVAVSALAAVALSLVGYLACGFAFQFGGLGLVASWPGLEAFQREWSPLDVSLGPGWGAIGLQGFWLQDPSLDTRAYAFFWIQWLPVIVATLIPLAALAGKVSNGVLLLVGLLMSGVIYPLFGNWVWGGGWLAHLGQNLGWGHGLVDFAGATLIFVLGGGLALAAIGGFRLKKPATTPGEPVRLPPLHFPLLMILGAFLTLAGWLAMSLSNPLAMAGDIHPITVIGNLFFAAAGGVMLPLLYTWFVAGKPDALLTARGLIAGLVAASASVAFAPTWAALLIGAGAGLLLPFALYISTHLLRWDDECAVTGTFLLPGLWGLLAVGLFASGRWGIGWNSVGTEGYLGIPDQGVTGRWPGPGFQADWPGQFQAQLAGVAAAVALSFLLPLILFSVLAYIKRLVGKRIPKPAPQQDAERPSSTEQEAV